MSAANPAAERFDVAVIGAGIAGAGLAAMLAGRRRTIMLETEERAGFHATGRSAAIYIASYGNAVIRALTAASSADFARPPDVWRCPPLLHPRGVLFVADEATTRALADLLAASGSVEEITPRRALDLVPILREERIAGAALEPGAHDIDVAALHQAWLALARREGAEIATRCRVTALHDDGPGWRIEAGARRIHAGIVVNAAGAWADEVAALAGLAPLGLTPCRRSMAVLPAPEGFDVAAWPLFGDVAETWYVKPETGRLLVSPADEDPVAPHDAFADDLVLAEGLHRFEQATTCEVRRLERSWAGLRTFAPDRTPVVGFDPRAQGFFWLAGQGGYGIQTAPALSRLAAALVLGEPHRLPLGDEIVARLSPARFAAAA